MNYNVYPFVGNFSVDIVNYIPVVSLLYPNNSLITNSSYQNFSCSAVDNAVLSNVTFFLWNSSDLYYEDTIELNRSSVSLSWLLNLIEGNYSWNCLAYDNDTEHLS